MVQSLYIFALQSVTHRLFVISFLIRSLQTHCELECENKVLTFRNLNSNFIPISKCGATDGPRWVPDSFIDWKEMSHNTFGATPHYPISAIPNARVLSPWASYQIRKIAGCACAWNAGIVFPRRRLQRKPLISDPGMHHGTCVTHVPWCMSGSLTRGGGKTFPAFPAHAHPRFDVSGKRPIAARNKSAQSISICGDHYLAWSAPNCLSSYGCTQHDKFTRKRVGLTLYMLNCFEEAKTHLHFSSFCGTEMAWVVEIRLNVKQGLIYLISQCHGWVWLFAIHTYTDIPR